MTNNKLRQFKPILSKTQKQLKNYLHKELIKADYKPLAQDGFLYAKGELPVLLIAHLDTVHKDTPCVFINSNGILSSPQGIGGDDRCGVYIILEIIKELKCSVLFTEDEEIGCVGATKFASSNVAKNIDVNYIIEFDRRGKNDAVFYDCDNPEFTEFITGNSFFKTSYGSFSDISIIAPELGLAAVNLSSGYYDEHTVKETINLSQVNRIIKEAKKLIQIPAEKFEYIESQDAWNGRYYDRYNDYDNEQYEFTFLWEEDNEFIEEFVVASSEMEAIGYFLMDHPKLTYDDIVNYMCNDDYYYEVATYSWHYA